MLTSEQLKTYIDQKLAALDTKVTKALAPLISLSRTQVLKRPYQFSVVPTPSTVPVSDQNGQLNAWIQNADAMNLGLVRLTNDLGGTANAPEVRGITDAGATHRAVGAINDGDVLVGSTHLGSSFIISDTISNVLVATGPLACLTSNQTRTAATLADISGLSVALLASKTYAIVVYLKGKTATTSNGWAINFSGAGSTLNALYTATDANAVSVAPVYYPTLDASISPLTVGGFDGAILWQGFIIVGANAGNLVARHMGDGATAVTTYAGSFIYATQLN